MDVIPDNKLVDIQLYVLDPLSVIIKLAILSNKPIGTKLHIDKNIIQLQEPGPFQSFCRYIYSRATKRIYNICIIQLSWHASII